MSAETPDPRPLEDIRADHAEAMQTLVTRHSHATERLVADIPSLVAELERLRRQHAAALAHSNRTAPKEWAARNRYRDEWATTVEDEPVVVFRARDGLLPALLEVYGQMCADAGSPARHLDLIAQATGKVLGWQAEHAPKTPDSESSRSWMP